MRSAKLMGVTTRAGLYFWGAEVPRIELARRQDLAGEFWAYLRARLWIFNLIPFLKMVGVMNSLACDNVGPSSDIDIFIVSARNRLWTTRAITLALLKLTGMRATIKNKYQKLSPDLFISEDGMDLSRAGIPKDYLLAYWVSDFIPVWQPSFFSHFWAANAWLADVLPAAYRTPRRAKIEAKTGSWLVIRMVEGVLSGRLGDWVERKLKARQLQTIRRNLSKYGQKPLALADDFIVKIHYDDTKRDVINRGIEEFLAQSREMATVD